MKSITKLLVAALAGVAAFATRGLAAWAEFGSQMTIPGLTAAASLNNHQYGVVRLAGQDTVNIASEVNVSGALKTAIGVLQNKPYNGEDAIVAYSGVSKVFGGGTVTNGAPVSYDSSGHVIDAVSGDVVIGRALETLTTAGEIGTVLLMPPVRWGSVA